uniref:Uncharacterized protein n=1 Tax=Arundo donax TaxID=35708 RepID=A0A0A8ZYF4_ARUDO
MTDEAIVDSYFILLLVNTNSENIKRKECNLL